LVPTPSLPCTSDLGTLSNELVPSAAPTQQLAPFVVAPSCATCVSPAVDGTTAAPAPSSPLAVKVKRSVRFDTLPPRVYPADSVRSDTETLIRSTCDLTELPSEAKDIVALPELSYRSFTSALRRQEIISIAMIQTMDDMDLGSSSTVDASVVEDVRPASTWDSLRDSPYIGLIREFADIFPAEVPSSLPADKGVRHEIDLVPGTKYCVTRQWPLPREQVDYIDAFFEKRKKAGQVRESISPHSSPTFCVKKATGGWRIVHAFNKLNTATIPAQTPIPRKDVIIDGMTGSTIFSTIDLRDGFYQILMRVQDIAKTAVSTPSGMLWEWLVMPQGLSNAPATFNRMVTAKLRPLRHFAPSYFDDIYIHSRASASRTDVDIHGDHLRAVFEILRANSLFANLQKCMFGVSEIPVLGDFVGVNGCRVDPSKVSAINQWPVPTTVTELRSWLGLATYLHKFSKNFAAIAQPLSKLLSKDEPWNWDSMCQAAFDGINRALWRLRSWHCQISIDPSPLFATRRCAQSVVVSCRSVQMV
jgi:hypothetical protein